MTEKINRNYYLHEETKTIYYHTDYIIKDGYQFIGSSDNPKPSMAAAVFAKDMKINMGYRLREL